MQTIRGRAPKKDPQTDCLHVLGFFGVRSTLRFSLFGGSWFRHDWKRCDAFVTVTAQSARVSGNARRDDARVSVTADDDG